MLAKLQSAISAVEKCLYTSGLLSARRLTLPDFLGIGSQKAGTTWLYENLRQHPQLYLPEVKEIHYFDWNFANFLSSYSRNFVDGVGRIKGEITPNYSTLSEKRIAFLQEILPDLRLIALFRNPIDRAWSQAMMNLVTKTGRGIEDVADQEFLDHFRHDRSVHRGDYLSNLDRWERFFPSDQFFYGFFESISQRPRELLEEIFQFLGVSTDVEWNRFPYNQVIRPGESLHLPDRFRSVLERQYCEDIEKLYQRFGQAVSRWRVP